MVSVLANIICGHGSGKDHKKIDCRSVTGHKLQISYMLITQLLSTFTVFPALALDIGIGHES